MGGKRNIYNEEMKTGKKEGWEKEENEQEVQMKVEDNNPRKED